MCFAGCRSIKTGSKDLYCPVPTVNCSPALWNGLPLDTGRGKAASGSYYMIEPVENFSEAPGEYSIAFLSSNEALVTVREGENSYLVKAVRSTAARFIREGNPAAFIKDNYGSYSYHPDSSYFSISPYEKNISRIIHKDGDDLVPMEYMPGRSRIFSAANGNFSSGHALETGKINDLVWESHPAIHPNGLTIFFASDRPGGYGGTDIWYMHKMGKNWLPPVNCGRDINTDCDDITPFVSKDGKKLLFSSMGHASVGGYDIFESDISYGRDNMPQGFSPAKNIRYPINTKSDEMYPSSPAGTDTLLYYSSDQKGAGDFDLFVYHKKYISGLEKGSGLSRNDTELQTEIKLPEENREINFTPVAEEDTATFILRGKVENEVTKEPIADAQITVREMPENKVAAETVSDKQGDYSIELKKGKDYEVTAQNQDLFYSSYNVKVEKGDTATGVEKTFSLPQQITLRITFIYDEFEKPYEYVLDSNGMETKRTWQSELDKIASNLEPSLDSLEKVVLIGHTDMKASESYNFRLGMQRAEFIYSELVKRGIPGNIMEVRSEGEKSPLPRRKKEGYELYARRLRRVTIDKVFKK